MNILQQYNECKNGLQMNVFQSFLLILQFSYQLTMIWLILESHSGVHHLVTLWKHICMTNFLKFVQKLLDIIQWLCGIIGHLFRKYNKHQCDQLETTSLCLTLLMQQFLILLDGTQLPTDHFHS